LAFPRGAWEPEINLPENPLLSPLVAKNETKINLSDITHKITISFAEFI
jgi:hypothetical protein